MAPTVTEFVFFKIRPDIRPENPQANHESESLLNLLQDTKHQEGYKASIWGRVVEDEDVIVWVIDWSDARGASRAKLLPPFLQSNTEVLTMYITLTPALDLNQLWETPVTELCPFTFSTAMSGPEHKQLNQDLIAMRADALNANKMDGIRPRFWSMGHVDRPGKRIHPDSSSGEAFVVLAVIGWESIEDHKRIREAEGYKWHMERNEGKLLPTGPGLLPGEGLGLSHVRFKGV